LKPEHRMSSSGLSSGCQEKRSCMRLWAAPSGHPLVAVTPWGGCSPLTATSALPAKKMAAVTSFFRSER
jgi:hypothetical protein